MIRTLFGGLLGGLAMFIAGFLFWGTPLSKIAFTSADGQASVNLQASLAQALTQTGTGVYVIPSTATSQGTILYGKGPIAQVFFNTSGFPSPDNGAMIGGVILSLVVGVLIALALRAIPGTAAMRVRVTVAFALATVLWMHIGQPIFNHAPWGYFLYLAITDYIGLVLAGVIAAKIMPDTVTAMVAYPAARDDPLP